MRHTFLRAVILLCVFMSGASSIVAEYSISTLSSYLIGDTIASWSIVIGFFMLFMGLGSYLAKHVERLVETFIVVELCISFFTATSVLFITTVAIRGWEHAGIFLYTAIIGSLVGFEIPIIVGINRKLEVIFEDNISAVLALDYIGSLVGSLLFALFQFLTMLDREWLDVH